MSDNIIALRSQILPVADECGEKYVCPICQKVLCSSPELTKHIRSHNSTTALAANTCTICGKQLSSQSSLDRHMLVHSGGLPENTCVNKPFWRKMM